MPKNGINNERTKMEIISLSVLRFPSEEEPFDFDLKIGDTSLDETDDKSLCWADEFFVNGEDLRCDIFNLNKGVVCQISKDRISTLSLKNRSFYMHLR